ncbi:maleylpyruvate isomerase N-terminal domain-containing protein [Streptomyces cuspidosporus]|uniref:Mycothiol-dependent maleylpyruvate isomerase metal-binding domain-containing protein n=1 Tax=Streptomyces cuspidosporus TaxID=66882 RepID=A0ABP5UCN4_9ACTN
MAPTTHDRKLTPTQVAFTLVRLRHVGAQDHALRDGAGRGAAEFIADLRDSLDRMLDEAAAMPADRCPTLVTALAGWRHPAWYTFHRARRELVVHHRDLKHSYTTHGWPTGYVTWAPDETAASLAARNFPEARFEATDLDRSWTLAPTGPTATGPGHALLAWLVGCGPDEDLELKRTADTTGVAAPADTGLGSRSPDR